LLINSILARLCQGWSQKVMLESNMRLNRWAGCSINQGGSLKRLPLIECHLWEKERPCCVFDMTIALLPPTDQEYALKVPRPRDSCRLGAHPFRNNNKTDLQNR